MAKSTSLNISNGIFSAITLASGIIYSALIGAIVNKTADQYGSRPSGGALALQSAAVWAVGFGFMIPGVIGLIATCARAKGGYITQMVFMIISLIVMGVFFVLAIIGIGVVAAAAVSNSGYRCIGRNCDYYTTVYGLTIGTIVMIVVGWIATLIATITGGILACQREENSYPGTVLQPAVNMGYTNQVPPAQSYAYTNQAPQAQSYAYTNQAPPAQSYAYTTPDVKY